MLISASGIMIWPGIVFSYHLLFSWLVSLVVERIQEKDSKILEAILRLFVSMISWMSNDGAL